jgi:Zn-finger nucleic acid-binding protein
MKCPVEGTPLVMSERQGVEIDHCPHCRGVWLDRGELDKIIERSAPRSDPGDARKKRSVSFLDDIFDF